MQDPTEQPPWVVELRGLHDSNFAFDWNGHVRTLNERLQLSGEDEFGLPAPGLPPSWFVGDIEALQRPWVLVVSLNQARREGDEGWHDAQQYTSQSYWDHWRWLNRDWWEPRFYRPLVKLASATLGTTVDTEQEADFATTRMIFVELCPYSSRRFDFSAEILERLARDDIGFQMSARVRQVLVEQAEPALVLVNGAAALRSIAQLDGAHLELRRRQYASVNRPEKELWHEEGRYTTDLGSAPLIGFPFLRKPRSHNSYTEIDQLGLMARALIDG